MQYEKLRRGRERKEIVIEARLLKPSELKKNGVRIVAGGVLFSFVRSATQERL